MSEKREDDVPDMEAGMTTAERRRRRRRGAGLRVPSDNVPRRGTGQHPVIAPTPEDPNLAVSIAYSFATDASGPMPREDLDSAPVMTADAVPEPVATPAPAPTPVEVARRPRTVPPPLRPTAEMAAAAPSAPFSLPAPVPAAAPASVPAPPSRAPSAAEAAAAAVADDDDSEEIQIDSSPEIRIEPTDGAPVAVDDAGYDAKTREMSAVNLEALGLSDADVGGDATTEIAAIPEPPVPVSERTTLEMPAQPASADAVPAPIPPAEADSGVEIEMEEEAEAVPIARVYRRTTTVALSEEDLEELMEAQAAPTEITAEQAPVVAALVPSLRRADTPVSGVRATKPRAASPEIEALADEDLADEVQAPADASDSGEILTEDLIEEVDAQAAHAVGGKPRPAAQASSGDKAAAAPGAEKAAAAPGADKAAAAVAPAAEKAAAAPADKAVAAAAAPGADKAAAASAQPQPQPQSGDGHAPVAKPPPAPKKEKAAARAAAVAAAALPADAGKKGKKKSKPWFEEIFDEDYLRTLPFLTPQATQAEARFVLDALGLEAGAQVLDLGCGYGRHAMELAARGFHVVGLDLSLPLLLRGADEAQRRGLTINFVQGDMRELDFDAQFDGAYCLFSTFGFFDDETNKKTAANLARALKPGAKVVIEILNRDYIISDLPTRVWWEGDGCVVLEEVEFNYFSSRIQSNRSVVFDDGRQLEQEISIRAYSLHELGKLLHAVGFRVLEVSGAIQTRGRFFGSHSRQILVVAERRPSGGTTGGTGTSTSGTRDPLDSTRG